MKNPYSPRTTPFDLFEASSSFPVSSPSDEVAIAIDEQTRAIYRVGAALTAELGAISQTIEEKN